MTIILLIIIVMLVILWLTNQKKSQVIINDLTFRLTYSEQQNVHLSGQIRDIEQQNIHLSGQVIDLQKQNIALNKYQGIVDTEQKIKEIIEDAQNSADSILDNANQELEDAIKKASELKSDAQREFEEASISAKNIKTQANVDATAFKQNALNLLDNVTIEAKFIIEQADKKAQEIAGDAYKAMQNATELEKTAKAMKNIIEGYGDKYLVPTYSLLDDLAEEFGHTEAGEKLKFVREKTRLMINNRTSAQCDYVEVNRKETAINFILDAFNGKVDSILSKVKKDNFGTLEQKIRDAYQVVNNNGKAFRNAVITPEYLNARIDELKWAVITQELKAEEQEEQRRIKEQIREEEKAVREFEKAIREAQKEEETLKKLIEKAQKEIDKASEEQKAKYEDKLRELEAQLNIAEEKNQRAISMAQQTKSGNVYIISNIGSFGENVYKIGMTRRLEPLDRIKELGDASVPFEFDVHSMIYSNNAPGLERELHKKFMRLQMNKVNPRKEFFRVTLADIKAEVDKMDINAKWTMVAEAKHYRESLVIEEAISSDKQKQLEWESFQLQAEAEIIAEEVLD
jgi:hypothetical protein